MRMKYFFKSASESSLNPETDGSHWFRDQDCMAVKAVAKILPTKRCKAALRSSCRWWSRIVMQQQNTRCEKVIAFFNFHRVWQYTSAALWFYLPETFHICWIESKRLIFNLRKPCDTAINWIAIIRLPMAYRYFHFSATVWFPPLLFDFMAKTRGVGLVWSVCSAICFCSLVMLIRPVLNLA